MSGSHTPRAGQGAGGQQARLGKVHTCVGPFLMKRNKFKRFRANVLKIGARALSGAQTEAAGEI